MTLNIDIPDFDFSEFKHLVLDYNGTIALDGDIINSVIDRLEKLSKKLTIHILTGDTYGTVKSKLQKYPYEIFIIPEKKQNQEKANYIKKLGIKNVIAIGNGKNDSLMLKKAGIGIALIQKEGLFTETALSSDILFYNINDALDSLLYKNRLKATLRN